MRTTQTTRRLLDREKVTDRILVLVIGIHHFLLAVDEYCSLCESGLVSDESLKLVGRVVESELLAAGSAPGTTYERAEQRRRYEYLVHAPVKPTLCEHASCRRRWDVGHDLGREHRDLQEDLLHTVSVPNTVLTWRF